MHSTLKINEREIGSDRKVYSTVNEKKTKDTGGEKRERWSDRAR